MGCFEMPQKSEDFAERLLDFATQVIRLSGHLDKSHTGRLVSNQLLRSATSAGANWEETCGAESRSDYVHKMQIVLKELRESSYWIKLIKKANIIPELNAQIEALHQETTELVKIIAKSVVTVKNKRDL